MTIKIDEEMFFISGFDINEKRVFINLTLGSDADAFFREWYHDFNMGKILFYKKECVIQHEEKKYKLFGAFPTQYGFNGAIIQYALSFDLLQVDVDNKAEA